MVALDTLGEGSSGSANHRLALNNYLQHIYKDQTILYWQTQQLGPEHQGLWEVIVFIDHVEYGRATASSVGHAKEVAAHRALAALRGA